MSKRTQRRKIRSLFLVLLLTLLLLVMSTYAWFSTNRQVEVTDITAKVVAAEGLQISLDATHWSSSVSVTADTLATAGQSETATGTKLSWPDALEPVSTIGEMNGSEVTFKYGLLSSNGEDLTGITDAGVTSGKYIAFDLYLKNSSSEPDGDLLQLDVGSLIQINSTNGVANTGLENSARVGFILYNESKNFTETPANIVAIGGAGQVAIWEPNYKKHINYIVNNVGRVTADDQEVTTYGLVAAATGDKEDIVIANAPIADYCDEQVTIQTGASVADDAITLQDQRGSTATDFTLGQNKIHKMRVYVWLEGQDVDCLDIASTGKQFDLVLNLRKPE